MHHEDITDHDLVAERPVPAETPLAPKVRGKKIEIQLPGTRARAEQNQTELELVEQYQKWKADFMHAAERNLRHLGLENVFVDDFRSLKHWDLTLYPKGEPKPPRNIEEDTKWQRAMERYFKRHPDIEKAAENADEDDFVLLVKFVSPKKEVADDRETNPEILWVRRVRGDSLQH